MNEKSTIPQVFLRRWLLPGILLLLTFIHGASAQVASLPNNELVRYNNPKTPPLSHVTGASWTSSAPVVLVGNGVDDPGNAYDSNTGNFASLVASLVGGGTQRITIDLGTDAITASAINPYFVGFDLMNNDLLDVNLGSASFKIKLFNGSNTTPVYEYTIDKARLLGLLGLGLVTGSGQPARIGFTYAPASATTFNRVMFEQSTSSLLALGSTQLYNLVLGKYVSTDYSTVDCNSNNVMGAPDYPFGVIEARTSTSGVTNPYGALSGTGYTEIGGLESALTGGVNYAVGDVFGTDLNTGGGKAFVGFDLENSNLLGLLNAGLLSNYTISLYKDGSAVPGGSFSGSNLLATNLTLLAGQPGRVTLGFLTDKAFDEIVLNVGSALSTNATKVHGVVYKPFCAATGGDVLACNTLTNLSNPAHPLYINGLRTGNGGVANLGTISDTENIINGSGSPAVITTVAGVAGSSSVSVANALETYPAGSFAGFDVESASLLQASVLGNSGIKIELYNSSSGTPNVPVFVSSGNILAGVGAISGVNRGVIGVVSNVAFDEVRLVIDQTITANVGNYQVHGVYFQKACDQPVDCSFAGMLSQETHGAVINADKTGVALVANASLGDEAMENPWNAVSASAGDFASMNALAGVLATTSLSVAATAFEFPQGTFAGFEVSKDGGLLDLGLLGDDNIQIITYNNGVQADIADVSGGGLIDLSVLAGSTGRSVIGFYSNAPFDEVRIRLLRTVSAATGYSLNIYGAVVSTQYVYQSSGLQCRLRYIRPDQNTGYINTPIYGNTSTNDDMPGGIYTNAGSPSIPSGANYNFTIDPDGSYTFQTDTPGTYTFNIQVCSDEVPGDCPVVELKIHVLDRSVENPPVAYRDYAVVSENSTNNIIPVKANDIPGNVGGTLGNPSLVTGPVNGSVTINGNGEAVYIPTNGFTGTDTFTYTICETPSGLCSGPVIVTVYVQELTSENTTLASDDQFIGGLNTPLSGNILANDTDAEGDTQSVALIDLDGDGVPETAPSGSAQDVFQEGVKVGTITVNATTGDIVFTPVTGYKGTVNVAVRIQDNRGATSQSTVVLIIKEGPDLTPTVRIFNTEFATEAEKDFLVDVWEINNAVVLNSERVVTVKIPRNLNFDITVPGLTLTGTAQDGQSTQSNYGGSNVSNTNGDWTFRQDTFAIYAIAKVSSLLPPDSNGRIAVLGFHIKRKAGTSIGTQNLTAEVVPYSGGEIQITNNIDTKKIALN